MSALLAIVGRLSPMAWLAIVLGVLVGVQSMRLTMTRADLAEERSARAAETAQRVAVAASASEAYRAEEQRRAGAHQEIAHEADQITVQIAADRRGADAAAGRLRQRVAATAASCGAAPSNPAASVPSPAASTPADLLAEVHRRIDEAAGGIADFADRASNAGHTCERSYDALKPPTASVAATDGLTSQ
jgi:hypothetical protein